MRTSLTAATLPRTDRREERETEKTAASSVLSTLPSQRRATVATATSFLHTASPTTSQFRPPLHSFFTAFIMIVYYDIIAGT